MGIIRLVDVDSVDYMHEFPDERDFEVADVAMDMAERKKLNQKRIVVFGNRIGIVLSGGDVLEYTYDFRTGDLKRMAKVDNFLKYWAMQYEEV